MNNTHTAYDVMKEYLITGAELDGLYQIPMLPKLDAVPGKVSAQLYRIIIIITPLCSIVNPCYQFNI